MARIKYSEQYCAYCNKTTKMVLVGEMQNAQDKIWYRCTRCHHMKLQNVNNVEENAEPTPIDMKTVTLYNPHLSFKVGEAIFHGELNDVGRVVNKIRTSDGSQAIVVAFEKQGQKTLLENLRTNGEIIQEA